MTEVLLIGGRMDGHRADLADELLARRVVHVPVPRPVVDSRVPSEAEVAAAGSTVPDVAVYHVGGLRTSDPYGNPTVTRYLYDPSSLTHATALSRLFERYPQRDTDEH